MPVPADLPKPGKLFSLGLMTQQAALRHPDSLFYLDKPFDLAPELGTRPTYAQVADLVEDTAARLYALGCAPETSWASTRATTPTSSSSPARWPGSARCPPCSRRSWSGRP
ncbi:hypothetical protein NKH77_09590 [Streptomyces sp. M19]